MIKKTIFTISIIYMAFHYAVVLSGCVSDASASPATDYSMKTVYHSGHTFAVYESANGIGMALIPE